MSLVLALLVLPVLGGGEPGGTRGDEAEVRAALRERAHPIASTDPAAAADDLAFLDALVEGQQVVLLGEEIHGVREFSRLKHRLIRTLVERHGFDTLVWEQDSLRGAEIDRYLSTGEGDPARTLATCYWCWNTAEVLDLVHDLRELAVESGKPVRFVGVDNQSPVRAVAELRAVAGLLELGDPATVVEPFGPGRDGYQELPEARRAAHRADLEALAGRLANQDGAEASRAREAVRILLEVQELWSAPNARARMNVRDRHMAERTLEQCDQGRQVLVWAHNAHASRAVFYGGVTPLGRLVSARVPTLVVGFTFGHGAWRPDPRSVPEGGEAVQRLEAVVPGSLGAVLAGVRPGLWTADLRAPGLPEALRAFLETPPPGHFDNYGPPPSLVGAIDVLVFVDEVSPALDPR